MGPDDAHFLYSVVRVGTKTGRRLPSHMTASLGNDAVLFRLWICQNADSECVFYCNRALFVNSLAYCLYIPVHYYNPAPWKSSRANRSPFRPRVSSADNHGNPAGQVERKKIHQAQTLIKSAARLRAGLALLTIPLDDTSA
jgi:hypothetical protein